MIGAWRRNQLLVGLGLVALVVAALALALFVRSEETVIARPPPRAAPTVLPPPTPSSIALPVRVPLNLVQQAVEDAVPKQLWSIDEPDRVCLKAGRVKLFKSRLKVTPDIKCHLVGDVERGPVRLTGTGKGLRLEMPLSAEITARDIGGLIPRETATARALVTADLVPRLTPDGHLAASIRLNYDWEQEPGVTLMGRRIKFTEKVDEKLAPVLTKAEVLMAEKLKSLPVRSELEKLWQSGFTVEEINHRNPPAWLRLKPLGVGLGSISSEGQMLRIDLMLDALAQVHLGTLPARPAPTPLPPIGATATAGGLVLNVGVLSDYATLEKVIAKALGKLAAKGVEVPDYGRIAVRFGQPTLYATSGGRLALGLDLAARGPRDILNAKGRVWLTARAETVPDSERVLIRDIQLFTWPGDDAQLPLLAAVASSDMLRTTLETALEQDFTRDYSKLMAKIDKALEAVKVGPFRLSTQLDDVRHGKVLALGQGLYLPVEARGTARLDYAR